jgi:uncharacterized protein (DUF1810 family)
MHRSPMPDPYDLQRFVDAQRRVYADVTAELKRGEKRSHWMWFIFPQVVGLGFSSISERFAIGSPEEAMAYLAHEVLGPRLRGCTRLVLDARDKTAHEIFGSPDDLKFRSSMTLFAAVSDDPLFGEALARYYGGDKDQATLGILARIIHNRRQL